MQQDEKRQLENRVLSRPLSEITSPWDLKELAYLLQDETHLREVLRTEGDRYERIAKFRAMQPYVHFETSRDLALDLTYGRA